MERRSRSQVRRIDNGLSTVSSRHASTTRADQPPLDPARTLSPDRKDRYRSSGRGNGNGGGFNGYALAPGGNVLYNGQMNGGNYPPQPDIMAGQGGIHLPDQPHGQHSNSNSYNQYTHNPPPIISTNPASLPPQSNVNGYGEYRPHTNGPLNGHNGGSNVNNGVIGSIKGSLNHSENSNTLTSQTGERIAWELHQVQLNRVTGFGFGIAVSGGRDNPHFSNGDISIAISDVLKGGPAEGKLMINDRVISANKISLEGVDYATAVQVLRDSGQSVNLVVKRRVVLPAPPEPQNIRVNLVKTKKKDDFGIVLGCKIYIKEIAGRSLADKEGSLQVGDLIQKLNNISIDGLSLKETRKILETSKEKLDITVSRDPYRSTFNKADSVERDGVYGSSPRKESKGRYEDTPPSRPPPPKESETSSLSEAATLPVSDVRPMVPLVSGGGGGKEATNRRNSRDMEGARQNHRNSVDYATTPRKLDDSTQSSKSNKNLPDPRFISFQKDGSVGIRLTGGNDSGIFVTAVQPGSPAAQQGLQPGDKIIKVNDMDMSGVTREEAVLYLLSLQRGDSFYIKAHFNYEQPDKGEMTFKKCDVFHVVDTLHNGVVGAWQAFRMDPFLSGLGRAAEQVQKGVIPNKARAEEIATKQFNAAKKEQSISEQSKSSFFKRRRTQNHRRSKSLGKDHWEDLVWSESMSKFPAYERVGLRHPGFPRPVVIFGAVADIARERLLRDFPLKFASPQQDMASASGENRKSGIVRLSAIRDIMDRGLHALLDVAPNAVDKLNYAQFYPIVLLARADSKQTIKDCRAGLPKKAHIPSKKLLEQSQKIEKMWSHCLTGTIHLHADNWYTKITDLIEKQQTAPIWMSDSKPDEAFSDDFLFPMSSRLTFSTSGLESDGEFCGEDSPRKQNSARSGNVQNSSSSLYRATSDPNLNLRKDGTMTSEVGENAQQYLAKVSPDKHGGTTDRYGVIKHQDGNGEKSKQSSSGSKLPSVPPKIDRQKKPSKKSAAERLFGQRAAQSPPEEKGSSGSATSNGPDPHMLSQNNSNSNSYNPHAAENYDSYKHRGSTGGPAEMFPHYASRNPGGISSAPQGEYTSPGQLSGSGTYGSLPNGMTPPAINGMSPPGMQNGGGSMNGYAMTGQHSGSGQDKYRYSEYKPMPPPKSSIYKPVPPPKPKPSFSGPQPPSSNGGGSNGSGSGSGQRSSSQSNTINESNYMNGNYINPPNGQVNGTGGPDVNNGDFQSPNSYQPDYNSYHYHSSKVVDNNHQYTQPSPPRVPPYDTAGEIDSNGGVDSGQGSSLDRDYSSYNRYNGPPPPTNINAAAGGNRSSNQYYYNLPSTPRDGQTVNNNNNGPPSAGNNGVNSQRRRPPGDTLDLSNREHRGSAFELYKKPGFKPYPSYGEVQR